MHNSVQLLSAAMRYLFTLLVCFLFFPFSGSTQHLQSIATNWSDSFAEWIIYTDNEEEEGYLRLRWKNKNDWTQWDYRIGEWTGQIRTTWPNKIDEWEVRGENLIVNTRMMWRDDPREWRISSPKGYSYKWKSRYSNLLEDWLVDSEAHGYFQMYTTYEGDPREWIIIDELAASLPEKMMLVFLTIINSTPKQ